MPAWFIHHLEMDARHVLKESERLAADIHINKDELHWLSYISNSNTYLKRQHDIEAIQKAYTVSIKRTSVINTCFHELDVHLFAEICNITMTVISFLWRIYWKHDVTGIYTKKKKVQVLL
jgi:hypothetical protein